MLEFKHVSTLEDIRSICDLADIIWHECYIENLSNKQIAYMLNVFLSPNAISKKIKEGTVYKLIILDNANIGFFAYDDNPNDLFLSKLYFLKQSRGNHIASKVISELLTFNKAISLTVNKNNEHAIAVYKHLGFEIIDSVVSDIGFGYVMDDYVMVNKGTQHMPIKHFCVCDMHCDTITKLKNEGKPFLKNNLQISLTKLQKGNYLAQCFAIFLYLPKVSPFNGANTYMDYYDELMHKYCSKIKPAYSYADIIANNKNNLLSSILTIEEGEAIEGDLAKLVHFYNRGVRMMTLTWNFPNQIGHPNYNAYTKGKDITIVDTVNGLTPFGLEVIKKMNELGMIIDVSHLSDAGFYDCIKNSTKPIVASHSNARAIQNVCRNLTDDMIRELAKNGGVMGINYCPDFVSYSKENQISDLVKHIKHIVSVGGINVCGLGSDFDGIGKVNGMSDATKTHKLYKALVKEGFNHDDIEKIFYKNFLRVFQEVCK